MHHLKTLKLRLAALLLAAVSCACSATTAEQPSILLIMTDDQGYSDVGYNGNPLIKTPTLDALSAESIVFDRFHAQPVCSPTRAMLMTGRYAMRAGVLDTQGGISILPPGETTVAEALKEAGYATGMYGKWHLGDNAPTRPQDQGFDDVLTHIGGMIGAPYSPQNAQSYFDPVLVDNGQEKAFDGYAPDVFTDRAIQFIRSNSQTPFFAFLSFNTPHHPLTASDKDTDPYRDAGLSEETARFYGMISNIDANIARVLQALDETGDRDNTVIIFLGDNGTSSLHLQDDLWEAGLRGRKTFVYDNGIRVPMFIHLPGNAPGNGRVTELTAVQDVMPTILELAGLNSDVDFDGLSLAPLLEDQETRLPERRLFFQFHRGSEPVPYRNIAVRDGDYKLVQAVGRGREPYSDETARFELYDIARDPNEKTDIAAQHPAIVGELKSAYDEWLSDTWSGQFMPVATWIGSELQNPVTLSRQDWQGGGLFDGQLGHYDLEVKTAGAYRMTFVWSELLEATHDVVIKLDDRVITRQILRSEAEARIEHIELDEGPLRLEAWVEIDGKANGFRFVRIEKL